MIKKIIKKITLNYKKLHKKIIQNLLNIFYRVCIQYHIIHRLTQFPYFAGKYADPARSALASFEVLSKKILTNMIKMYNILFWEILKRKERLF